MGREPIGLGGIRSDFHPTAELSATSIGMSVYQINCEIRGKTVIGEF